MNPGEALSLRVPQLIQIIKVLRTPSHNSSNREATDAELPHLFSGMKVPGSDALRRRYRERRFDWYRAVGAPSLNHRVL